MIKRFFDIFCSSIGLLLLLPIFAIVVLLIKIDSKGPVFFRQERIGKNFKPFFIYKFRTMVKDAEKKGGQITISGDNRVTRVGLILRKTKIDELPQLINVLKGEMSLVGPRPEVKKYVEFYKNDYKEILKIKPGITDLASILYRNEESVLKDKENPEEYYKNILLPKKIELAKEYIKNYSFSSDLKLIFLTIIKIILPSYDFIGYAKKEFPKA